MHQWSVAGFAEEEELVPAFGAWRSSTASHFSCLVPAELYKRRYFFNPLGITVVPNLSKFKLETCRCKISSLDHGPVVGSGNSERTPSGFTQRSVWRVEGALGELLCSQK